VPLTLTPLPGAYAICRLPPDAATYLAAGGDGDLWSLTRTPDEQSIVCRAHHAPSGALVDAPWCALRLEGPFDLQGETGIIASVATPLAAAEISVFAMATYDTDYVLVPAPRAAHARAALTGAGHEVAVPATTLRAPAVADLAAVERLVHEAFLTYRATFAPPGWEAPGMELARIAERYALRGPHPVVAVAGHDRVIGVAALIATDEPDLGHVWQLFVDPGHHGTGLADLLLDALSDGARADGLRRLRLFAAQGAVPARAFYARRGWVEDRDDATEGPGGLPVVLLRRAL